MSALVLKMTTAASSIYSKNPYQKLPLFNPNFPNFPNFHIISLSSTTITSAALNTLTTSNTNSHKPFQAYSQTPRGHNQNGSRTIPPRAPPQNLRPRFPKCLSASARSSSSGADSQGGSSSGSEPGGLMADMGSENKAGPDWFDSQLYTNQDELLSPLQPRRQLQQQQQPPQDQQHQSASKFLTLPTILTLGRVAAVPILISTFYIDSRWGTTATTSIFIAAAITDWLDGYIARKMRLGSAFGAFLDPVADKLMVAATLVLLCSRPLDLATFGNVPWLLVVPSVAIIGREITMSAVREWAASQSTKLLEAVAVNNLGKYKTATQMIALTVLLATRDSSLGRPEALVASGVVLLYISAGLAVWSLVVYMSKIWKVLLK